MTQVIGTVTAAGPIQKPKRDGTFFTLNEVTIDGQVYVARKDVCNLATGMLGQRVSAITRVEVKGDYTNFYLDFIEPAGGGSQPGQAEYVQQAQAAQVAQTYVPQPLVQQPVQTQVVQQPNTIGGMSGPPITPAQQVQGAQAAQDAKEEARTASIHRQTAAKVAAVLVRDGESPWDFWLNVSSLVAFFSTGVYPSAGHVQAPQQAYPQPGSETRANAAAYQPAQRDDYGDPGSQLPPPTDDGIPF